MSVVIAVFYSLVHAIWQGVVFQLAAWLLTKHLRSAPQRYAALCAAQLGLAVAFLATLVAQLRAAAHVPTSLPLPETGAATWLAGFMLASVAAWSVGFALMLARLARAAYGVQQLRQRGAPLSAWQPMLDQRVARLGLWRAVAIVEAAVDSPLTLGWLRPVVFLPLGWATDLPPHVIEAAILHELMHVRRHDYLVNVAQHVLEALFFFHPSVWWLSRHVRRERELCCDQAVVLNQLDPLDYASALLAIEQQRSFAPNVTLGLPVARGELSSRIEHVLSLRTMDVHARRTSPGAAVTALALTVAAALGACLGATDAGDASHAVATTEPALPEQPTAATSAMPRWLPESVSRFATSIETAATAHGVAPALVALVVLLESRGIPDATSPGGAVGLMQLMPRTAAAIAAERGLAAPTPVQLRDVAFNLDFGAYLLARQLAPHAYAPDAQQVHLAAIEYNGGPKMLRAYLEGGESLSTETERYSRLLGALWSERDADASATWASLSQ
jgi:beta-lactamase regulating signal transducer with metallopeptidase domain